MLSYSKLWILLETKGMKKTDLRKVISGNTVAKLTRNENVNTEVIEKICAFLRCQPADIMEYVSEETIKQVAEQMDVMQKIVVNTLKEQGMTEDEFKRLGSEIMSSFFSNTSSFSEMFTTAQKEAKDE